MFSQKSFVPRLVSVLLVSFIIVLLVPVGAFTEEEATTPPSEDSTPALPQDILEPQVPPSPEQPSLPGTIEGTGTNFSVTDSKYLNITLDSSQSIELKLMSVPDMVTIETEAAAEATSSEITLSGFAPLTTYHKYEDDYHNHTAFTTDETGKYTYTQDLSQKHLVFIQPKASTIFLNSTTGWSNPAVGTWDPSTKTAVLTQDVNETIQIDSNDITLDGNGHFVTGANTGYGVYLSGRTGVTVKNLIVRNFSSGIVVYASRYNTIEENTASSNRDTGIFVVGSADNTLKNNTAKSNIGSGIRVDAARNTLTNNTTSSNYGLGGGIFLYGGANNTLTNNTSNSNAYFGFRLFGSSNNNTLTNNTANFNIRYGINLENSNTNVLTSNNTSNNGGGILVWQGSSNNTLTNNTANYNSTGISLDSSSNNTLTNNTANLNWFAHGILLYNSSSNTLRDNTANSNKSVGIFVYYFSNSNTLTNNTASNNYYGTLVQSSSTNKIYNNSFISNSVQAQALGGTGNVFNLPAPIGGNYWSNWTTPDANNDGFVDNPYVFTGGQDNLPWATQNGWLNKPPVAEAGGPYVGNEASPITFDGSASTDADGNIVSYEWDLDNDGAFDDATEANPSYTWADDYSGTVGLRVTDDKGAQSTDTAQVSVNNVVPEVYINSVSQPNPLIILPGNQLKFRGSFFDEGWEDTHTASWDFGDGTVIPGSLTEENVNPDSSGTLMDIHAYSAPGTYTSTLTITDDDGAAGKDTVSVHVVSGSEGVAAINAYIQALPDAAFVNNSYQRKSAFENKLFVVQSLIASGDYQSAINKLENDLLRKLDGFLDENSDLDWIVDVDAQKDLYYSMTALSTYLKTLL